MKLIKQNKLLSSVLTSDIIYFSGNISTKKDSNFFSNKIKIKNQTRYVLLNVIVLLQSIKQIIRLLQFNLKHYKNFLQIITSNNLYNQIIEYISKTYAIKDGKIKSTIKFDKKFNSKMVAYIGDDVSNNVKHIMSKSFNNNINLIVLINSCFNKNISGNYKMLANINNYKKLIFLIIVILLSQKNVDKKLENIIQKKN